MSPPNVPAENTSYFTPAQQPPVGAVISLHTDAGYVNLPPLNFSISTTDDEPGEARKLPVLFTPITIRSLTFQNRIFVAPMCMYSCASSGPATGKLTPFHLVHLGQLAQHGCSLTFIEATSVTPNGRISPHDSGLWNDEQIAGILPVAEFVHSQGQKLGIQLAHAGRKASSVPPWLAPRGQVVRADEDVGGWPKDVKGPSAIAHSEMSWPPQEMTVEDIEDVKLAFVTAARRAVKAGVDVIEIHAAHGYLLCQFLSPLSNQRTDAYGGSFANRVRLVIEVCQGVRAAIPAGMPLFLRVSSTEWMEHEYPGAEDSWNLAQTIELAKMLPAIGVDLLDVSSGGNSIKQKMNMADSTYQIGLAGQVREALFTAGVKGLLIGAVGMITEAEQASKIVEEPVQVTNGVEPAKKKQKTGETPAVNGTTNGDSEALTIEDENGQIAKADIILVARQLLREPEWVLRIAYKLGVDVKWPNQYGRAYWRKGTVI